MDIFSAIEFYDLKYGRFEGDKFFTEGDLESLKQISHDWEDDKFFTDEDRKNFNQKNPENEKLLALEMKQNLSCKDDNSKTTCISNTSNKLLTQEIHQKPSCIPHSSKTSSISNTSKILTAYQIEMF